VLVVAEQFLLQNIIKKYRKHPVSSDGGGTHMVYVPSYEKSIIIERGLFSIYQKDSTENFDDYFPYNKNKCKLKHVINWFHLFVDYYNKEVIYLS
jgi:hypothetical protein